MDLCWTLTEIQWDVTKDVAAVVGSVASACTVVGGVTFGWLGLKTWRQQLQGTANHELSRKLLVAIYSYEIALNDARDVGMSPSELSEEETAQISTMDPDPKRYAFSYSVYRARLGAIERSLAPVRALLLEARALWGHEVDELVVVLINMKDEWWNVARRYTSAMNPGEDAETRERYARAWIEKKGVLYVHGADDKFGQKFKDRLSEVEAFLRTKM